MATQPARVKTQADVIACLRSRQSAIVDAFMREIVPTYDRHQEELADMREVGERFVVFLLDALAEQRQISADEFAWTRSYFRRALLRGATEQECIRAARLWQRIVFDELQALAGPGELVARLARPLIDYVDAVSDAVTEIVAEIHDALELTGRDGRRELVEDLIAGRPLSPGTTLGIARSCGLDEGTPLVVVSARPVGDLADRAAVPVAAVVLARAAHDAVEPLFALRDEEIVVVRAAREDAQTFATALDAARCRLARDGVELAVGVSRGHEGSTAAAQAYAEACIARECVTASGGVLAVGTLDPLEYLFARAGDDTAWSLVDPAIRRFIETDLGAAGLLVDTLDAYVGCNLNVKQAAERLFVHTNTAHYRLAKIEELTGRDLRDLSQLQELVIALRLARRRARA